MKRDIQDLDNSLETTTEGDSRPSQKGKTEKVRFAEMNIKIPPRLRFLSNRTRV